MRRSLREERERGLAAAVVPRPFEPSLKAQHELKRPPEGVEIYVDGFVDLRTEANFITEHNSLSQFGSANPTVLLAEDSEDARHVLSLELQHWGCRVLTATDGGEAVETALVARPDLILMDLNLPRLDGLAAAERIRAHSELDGVPIIAVTAFDTYGIREAALEAGCQAYLLKPLNTGVLERALRDALPGFDLAPGGPSS